MATLTDEQVDFIARAIHAQGIRLEDLHDNLLDHICILVEQGMEQGERFEEVLAKVFRSFYRKQLYELEEEALFLDSIRGPRLLLSRNRFFKWLFGIFLTPYAVYFLLAALQALPEMSHSLSGALLRWTMVGSFWPLVSTVVVYFTPEHLDPLVPRHSKVLLGGGALIRVFRYEAFEIA